MVIGWYWKNIKKAYNIQHCGVKTQPLSEPKLPLSVHYIEHTPKHINQGKPAECTNAFVSIPIVVQWREDSKIIEAIAENDFCFQRLHGMVCTTEVKQDHLYILRQSINP